MNRIGTIALIFASLAVTGCSLFSDGPAVARNGNEPGSGVYAASPGDVAVREALSGTAGNASGVAGSVGSSGAGVGASAGALRQHTFVAEGADADVAVDPTGKWIVFTSTRHSEHAKIYIQKVDGVAVTQLTTDNSDDAQPSFSEDGKKIAFASNRSGRWAIYSMDADGRNVVQLTGLGGWRGEDLHPSFSPDQTQLAYCSLSGKSGVWEIWVLDLTTNARRIIGEGMFPSWCPDKNGVSKIAFQHARQRGNRQYSIWTVNLENGEPRELTEVAWSADAALVTPTWSPDGKQLAYASVARTEVATKTELWVVDADGSSRRKLTDGGVGGPQATGTAVSPAYAMNGRLFFISDRGGAESVWSVFPGSLTPAQASAEKPAEKTATAESAPGDKGIEKPAPQANNAN